MQQKIKIVIEEEKKNLWNWKDIYKMVIYFILKKIIDSISGRGILVYFVNLWSFTSLSESVF